MKGYIIRNARTGFVFLSLFSSHAAEEEVAGDVDISEEICQLLKPWMGQQWLARLLLYGVGATRGSGCSTPIEKELLDISRIAKVLCG